MSHENYQAALARNVQSAWNLHTVSLERKESPSFFIMLSSTAGVVGHAGEAHNAGRDAFQDALAMYRSGLGLPSTSINIGPVNDNGLLMNSEESYQNLNSDSWSGINEATFRRILDSFLTKQHHGPSRDMSSVHGQVFTGLAVPQPESSKLLRDIRLSSLRTTRSGNPSSPASGRDAGQDRDLQKFLLCARSNNPDYNVLLSSAVGLLQAQFTKMLRLGELIDPAYPLNTYGMDSLAAAEPRSWVRTIFGVQLTTLDVVNATSLVALSQKIISKMGVGKEV